MSLESDKNSTVKTPRNALSGRSREFYAAAGRAGYLKAKERRERREASVELTPAEAIGSLSRIARKILNGREKCLKRERREDIALSLKIIDLMRELAKDAMLSQSTSLKNLSPADQVAFLQRAQEQLSAKITELQSANLLIGQKSDGESSNFFGDSLRSGDGTGSQAVVGTGDKLELAGGDTK